MQFTLATAQEHAAAGSLESWIHAYLSTGEWANPGLSDGLKLQKRWWIGPVETPLLSLVRCCGAEPYMEYRVPEASWEQRISSIAASLMDVSLLPPLIVQYRNGEYSIRDGNHRHEAMRRKGWTSCWVLIWYDDLVSWQQSPYHD